MEAAEARRDPALLASFRALRLNLGESDVEVAVLLDAGLWASIEGDADRTGAAVWGIDLGGTAAQSAVACYWPETGALAALAAFGSSPNLAERGVRDGVEGLYVECGRRGELLTLGRRTVPVADLLAEALSRFGRPTVVVADRWREGELRDALEAARIPAADLVVRGQGFRDGGEDVRAFRRACAEGRVTPSPSLLLRSAMAEAPHRLRTRQGTRSSARPARAAAASGLGTTPPPRASAATPAPRPRRRRYALAG